MANIPLISFVLQLVWLFLLYGLYQVVKLFYVEITCPIRDLPGPKNTSLFFGNVKEIASNESDFFENWVSKYGRMICFNGLLGRSHLYVADPKAVNYILTNSYDFPKTPSLLYDLSRLFGPGLLIVEGSAHKQQRRIMNPAFTPARIREMTDIFIEKSIELRDIWAKECKQTGTGRIDILLGLSKMTLDVIGLAGFNYKLDALTGRQDELNNAFSVMLKADAKPQLIPMLRSAFPILRFIPDPQAAQIRSSRETLFRIGNELLAESKASASNGNAIARDLLSLLVQSNIATDRPEHQRLSDYDVIAQIPTFMLAGHETTSLGVMWALFALAQDHRVQRKLRNELLTVQTDNPTMDELNALPYLDNVIRETMRVHPPVAATDRISGKDHFLPLSEPVTDRKGKIHNSIRIKKGQLMIVSFLALHMDKSIWGEDAHEFKPERWESIPESVQSIPGVWGNLLTFWGGARACIGFRFSLVEMKALLFTLGRAFEFELAVPATDVFKKSSMVVRPVLATDPDGRNQLPLLIKPYKLT